MRKQILIPLTLLTLSLVAPLLVFAQVEIENPLEASEIWELIKNVSGIIFKFAAAIAPVMIAIAGFMFLTSGGDMHRVQTAKRILVYTAVGFAIALLQVALYNVIILILGGTP